MSAVLTDLEAAVVICDLEALRAPDAVAVDGLARLQLVLRRRGVEMEVCNTPESLLELLSFAGLQDVVRTSGPSAFERERKTEEREHPLGIQEEAELDDPAF